jgi:spermidine/putrescine transport system permease protein
MNWADLRRRPAVAATSIARRQGIRRKYHGLEIQRFLFGAWTLGVFGFLYVPILLLVTFSFNSSRLNIRWGGFSLKWYGALLQNSVLLEAFKNSLIVATATTLFATLLGTMGAWMLYRYRFPFQRVIGLLIFIPMVIPEVLMGVSLLAEFVHLLKLPLGYTTLIIAHTTFCFPFVLVSVQASLRGLDPCLEEAAMDLGATPAQAFRLVILPYLLPAVISGALMSFTLSLDEYIVSVFTAGSDSQTLPLKVYGMAKIGLNPQLNALSTLFVIATILLVLFSELLIRRKAQ